MDFKIIDVAKYNVQVYIARRTEETEDSDTEFVRVAAYVDTTDNMEYYFETEVLFGEERVLAKAMVENFTEVQAVDWLDEWANSKGVSLVRKGGKGK